MPSSRSLCLLAANSTPISSLVRAYLVDIPQIVMLTDMIVASGFDAAAGDDLGGCFVTPACYAHMTHMLMTLANGKVAVCLEVLQTHANTFHNSSHIQETGRIQFQIDFQIGSSRYQDINGRTAGPTHCYYSL
jgi:hypothetical protein